MVGVLRYIIPAIAGFLNKPHLNFQGIYHPQIPANAGCSYYVKRFIGYAHNKHLLTQAIDTDEVTHYEIRERKTDEIF